MDATITVQDKDAGNARRGYHNTDTTITFSYNTGTRWTEEREQEIVGNITQRESRMHMWWRVKSMVHDENQSVYVVNYGFDSGD